MEINRTTYAFGRDTGFSFSGSPYAVTYGRFHSVFSSVSLAFLAVQYGGQRHDRKLAHFTPERSV